MLDWCCAPQVEAELAGESEGGLGLQQLNIIDGSSQEAAQRQAQIGADGLDEGLKEATGATTSGHDASEL